MYLNVENGIRIVTVAYKKTMPNQADAWIYLEPSSIGKELLSLLTKRRRKSSTISIPLS